jgi:hypothetical protein
MKHQLAWLGGILIISALLAYGLLPAASGEAGLSVQLADTYFVFDSLTLLVVTFVIITFFVFSVRRWLMSDTSFSVNSVLLISNCLFVLLLTKTVVVLASLSHTASKTAGAGDWWEIPITLLIVVQLIALGMLVWVAFSAGKANGR